MNFDINFNVRLTFCQWFELSSYIQTYFPESPSFLKTPLPVEGIQGKDTSLHCEMEGTQPFKVMWFKDRRALKESRKYKMVSLGNSAALHVMKLEQNDVGLYECQVSNSVGSEICQTSITLKGKV